MPLIVLKYGGSSLATPRHIQRASKRIKEVKSSGRDVVVVVSAMGHATDHLIKLAHKTVRRPPQRELDMLLTAGERVSMALLAMALHEEGVPAISLTGSQSGILTSSEHTEAKIIDVRGHRIRDELAKGKVVIIAGFQGVSQEKEITTLGRGGSDTTAVALAAWLGADCDILTDVDGLFTADPHLVASARLIEACSYDEALELASLGAKMQSRSLELAKRYRVRVRIASSMGSATPGTHIPTPQSKGEKMESTVIRGIATREGYHFFRVGLKLDQLLAILQQDRIALRFFSFSPTEVSFLVEQEKASRLQERLQECGGLLESLGEVAVVSAVGEGLSASTDALPRFLETLRVAQAEYLLICANALSMTVAIPAAKKQEVTRQLHERLVDKQPV
jgi:aspartate kinase